MRRVILLFPVLALASFAQTAKDARTVAKQGTNGIPTLAGYLNAQSVETRVEVVKQLIALGGKDTIDPLIKATHDNDAEVQIRATDGLVNYYLPGYVKQGLGSTLVRAGATIRAKFGDTNDQVVPAYVIVRPDVIAALGQLARSGASLDSRANACRAVGILRGQDAVPDVIEALRTKDNQVMVEALIALQKIGDQSAGPRMVYLLRDLDDKVQSTAIETAGLLRATDGLPALRSVINSPRNQKAERSALFALAMMPEKSDRTLLGKYLASKDDRLRAAAAEGLARIADPADQASLDKLWKDEDKMLPRLAAAFGLVMDGSLNTAEDAPFRYLLNTLNSERYRQTAAAYLTEAARKATVREAVYKTLDSGTKDEKIQLSRVLSVSGDEASVPYLEKISRDNDNDVAQEGLRALRSLRARLKI